MVAVHEPFSYGSKFLIGELNTRYSSIVSFLPLAEFKIVCFERFTQQKNYQLLLGLLTFAPDNISHL